MNYRTIIYLILSGISIVISLVFIIPHIIFNEIIFLYGMYISLGISEAFMDLSYLEYTKRKDNK